MLNSSLYADEVNTGCYTLEDAFEFCKVSKQIMQDGSFNLRKCHSNSKELLPMIQSNENSHLFSKSGVTDKSPNEETIKDQE